MKIKKEDLKVILGELACGVNYEKWNKKFVYERLIEKFGTQDWNEYTREELEELGFVSWDGEVVLIPLALFRLTKKGAELTCISGEKMVYTDELDDDIRFGCVGFGVKKEKINQFDNFIKRMEIELRDLQEKIEKGTDFISKFGKSKLDEKQFNLLERQINAMSLYAGILEDRIKNEKELNNNN